MKARPLAIASAGAFLTALSTSLVAVSSPVIARDLGCAPGEVSWVLTSYLLAITCLLALAGKTADVLGQKRVYLLGLTVFIAGSAMCASSTGLQGLVGARVVQGVGGAMLMAVGPAIVTRAVPPERRARGLGIQLATTYSGLALGPPLGGGIAAALGWSAVFVVVAAAGAITAVLAVFLLPRDELSAARPSKGALDLGGAAFFGLGVAGLLIALKRTQQDGWTHPAVLTLVAVSLGALALLARHEARQASPLLPIALFRRRSFTFGVLGATLLYAVAFMLSYLLPFELQGPAALGPGRAGAFMTAQPVAMAVVAPLSGAIADRWGPRLPTVAGMVAIAGGMLGIARSAATPGAALVLSLVTVGVGAGLFVAPNSAVVMSAAPRDRQSTAGAMVATARNLGMTVGIALAATLHHAIGFEGALVIGACIAFASALLGLTRPAA